MTMENYLSELASQLHLRGLDDSSIREIIAEVENHLHESGETPEGAFGTAMKYAEEMTAFRENQTNSPPPDQQWHERTFRATAFDEMETLKWAGLEGWELVDVGPLALFCRRPAEREQAFGWEYIRRTGTHPHAIRKEMAEGNWEPCGCWIVFHYFKRKVGPLGQLGKPGGV
jgi:hypothetical protein